MQRRIPKATLVVMRAVFLVLPMTLVAGPMAQTACAQELPTNQSSAAVTHVAQVRLLASQIPSASYLIRLQGDVWWANPASGKFVLKDDSGAEELEMDLAGQSVEAGQSVRLEGSGTISPAGAGFKIGAKGPVVDNDGVHGMVGKVGAVFLKAGRNPIRVEWFNGVEKYGLEVDYHGSGVLRQKIPDSALFRAERDPVTGVSHWMHGLDYKCCEAPGEILPDFNLSPTLAAGHVNNFDLSVMARPEHVGLRFAGFLDVPSEGLYIFHTKSDDGSRLFVGEPSMRANVLGRAEFPAAQPAAVGQSLRPGEDGPWVEIEGKVTFASDEPDGLKLELSARTGRMKVEIPNGSGLTSTALLNRRVRARGFGQGATTIDGQRILSVLLVPSRREIELLEAHPADSEIKEPRAAGLPLLVNASDIHRLKREEAQRGYPVKIQGVITSVQPEHQAFTMQDSTRGIYVIDFSESRSDSPQIGDFVEVEGVTDPGLFAPMVNARRVQSLGAGASPEPLHPTRDQMMNGSLDAQYVEIQGILTSVQDDGVTLLTNPDIS
jgi:hypothetical protein